MNTGLLVILALFLIYLAVTGRYSCVAAASKCVFGGAKLCECGTQTAQAGQRGPSVTQLPGLETGVRAGREILDRIREIIDAAK
jgi:hypothetical protein